MDKPDIPGYILVVVDMQPLFRASKCPALLSAVESEVAQAVAQGLPVLVLECYPQVNGATHQSLLAPLAGYDTLKHIVLQKQSSSGGRQVFEACRLFGWDSQFQTVRFCGVNTTDCVFETASDLSLYLREMHLTFVSGACADEFYPQDHSPAQGITAWQLFAQKAERRFAYELI